MKVRVVLFLLLSVSVRAENLFSNGTLDTAGGWKGDRRIVGEEKPKPVEAGKADPENEDKEKPNRCLLLTAKMKDAVSFNQEVDSKDVTSLTVKFSYKTKDYAGGGLELRGRLPNRNSTFTTRPLVADGGWHEMTWVFGQISGSNKIDFSFTLLAGQGEVYFDNLSVEAN